MANPFIKRTVSDKVGNTMEIVKDPDKDEIKINSSWEDELDGDLFEEKFESVSVSSDDASMDSDSYESEETEDSSDESQIEESQTFKEVKIHSDIEVIVLEEDEYRYLSSDIQCDRWTAEDRKKTQIPLTEDDFEITDIYRTAGLFTATEISVSVKVNLPKTHIPHHAVFEYFLLVETDDHDWLTLPSFVTSNNTSLTKLPDYIDISSICAIARRISEKLTVTEDGYEFISSLDTRLKLDFPKGAVDHNTHIEIQVLPIDHERVRELKEYNPRLFNTILNMSDVVSVKYEHTKDFNKNVKIQLPLSLTTPNDDDYVPLFIRWNGNQPEILNDILSEAEPDIYSTAVSHFSDAAVVLAHRNASREDTLYVAEMMSGKSEACNILTFYTFGILGSQPSLWVELVLSKNKEEIRKKRQAEGLMELPFSYSPDMEIKKLERVHVALKLNVEFPPGICKSTFYLKFDRHCISNHFTFPILKKSRMCAYHYVVIEYEFSKSKEIHPIHFDPDTMKKNMLLPPRTSDGRKQAQRQNTGFGMEGNASRIAWPDKSPQNMDPNQGQAHDNSESNPLHRQMTSLPSNISLPPPQQLSKSGQSFQDTRRTNQGQAMLMGKANETNPLYRQKTSLPSNISLPPPQLAKSGQSFHNTRRQNQGQAMIMGKDNESNPLNRLKTSLPSIISLPSTQQDQTITHESLTDTDTVEDPMFSEESMMMFADTLSHETGKKLAICLGFSYEEIKIMSENTSGFGVNFSILVNWLQKTNQKSKRPERFGILKKAFQSIGRGDYVELIEKVRSENRAFTNKDRP